MSFVLGLVLGGATIIFVLQNMVPVEVSFFSWQTEGSLAILILLAVFVGITIASLFSIPALFEIAGLKRHTRRLERELEAERHKLSETKGKLSQAEAPVVLVEEKTLEDSI